MEDIEASRLVFETLSALRHIETSLVSMWPLSNKYARIPFLRFRFSGLDKEDLIYSKLKDIIENYSGNVRWCLSTRADVPNYILMPRVFERYFLEHLGINKENVVANFTEEEYMELIDTVIADVPNLANHINTSFKE